MSKTPTMPAIHLNGSGLDYLTETYSDALDAIRNLEKALRQCAPHVRDYYPLGNEAFAAAEDEHTERMLSLGAMEEDIRTIYYNLKTIQNERTRRRAGNET
jgi:hypothetical protein